MILSAPLSIVLSAYSVDDMEEGVILTAREFFRIWRPGQSAAVPSVQIGSLNDRPLFFVRHDIFLKTHIYDQSTPHSSGVVV